MKPTRFTARSGDPIRRIFCPGWRTLGVIYRIEYIGSRTRRSLRCRFCDVCRVRAAGGVEFKNISYPRSAEPPFTASTSYAATEQAPTLLPLKIHLFAHKPNPSPLQHPTRIAPFLPFMGPTASFVILLFVIRPVAESDPTTIDFFLLTLFPVNCKVVRSSLADIRSPVSDAPPASREPLDPKHAVYMSLNNNYNSV